MTVEFYNKTPKTAQTLHSSLNLFKQINKFRFDINFYLTLSFFITILDDCMSVFFVFSAVSMNKNVVTVSLQHRHMLTTHI